MDLIGVAITTSYLGPALAKYFGWHATTAQDTSLNCALSSTSRVPLPSDLYSVVTDLCETPNMEKTLFISSNSGGSYFIIVASPLNGRGGHRCIQAQSLLVPDSLSCKFDAPAALVILAVLRILRDGPHHHTVERTSPSRTERETGNS